MQSMYEGNDLLKITLFMFYIKNINKIAQRDLLEIK